MIDPVASLVEWMGEHEDETGDAEGVRTIALVLIALCVHDLVILGQSKLPQEAPA